MNFSQNQFLLFYDSTPFASKGHVAVTFPCNEENPSKPLFQILSGRAPDLFTVPVRIYSEYFITINVCISRSIRIRRSDFRFGTKICW